MLADLLQADLKCLEIQEYRVDQLRFKKRHKHNKMDAKEAAELKELEKLEKEEGKSKLDDN